MDPGGRAPAREAGISRAALYRTWGHLKERHQPALSALTAKDDELQRLAAS
ncbi:hypothetical protein ACFYXH_12970 [Streptomyces sp. NPDC002730]|uniref:hypothetical protein n=1 Tax=Streptomyces sp. NPDC002730 TaxID=3364662 RepID=UPI003685D633